MQCISQNTQNIKRAEAFNHATEAEVKVPWQGRHTALSNYLKSPVKHNMWQKQAESSICMPERLSHHAYLWAGRLHGKVSESDVGLGPQERCNDLHKR